MKNMRIDPTSNDTFVIRADTPRCGECGVMFESYNAAECSEYLVAHGSEAFLIEPADDTSLLYSDNLREYACIGHLRGDFGSSGNEFWTTWWPHSAYDASNTCFKALFDALVNYLRTSLLASLSSMRCYVSSNPIPGSDSTVGYRIQTGQYDFYIRCCTLRGNYNFYIYSYHREVSA